jgi:WD40 repeat protein
MDGHAQGWQRGREYRIPIHAGAPLDWVCLPRLGRKTFVACSDGTIKVYQPTPFHQATLRGHTDWVYGLAASDDGTRLASASGDGTVKLWSTADGKLLATLAHLRPKTDEWLIVTADGYFATSNDAAVKWKTANVTVAEEKLAALKQPDAVRETLSGKPPAPPSLQ